MPSEIIYAARDDHVRSLEKQSSNDDLIRAEFEAWFADESTRASVGHWTYAAWQAAYALGMQRAAEICVGLGERQPIHDSLDCAAAIRAEIKE